MFVKIVFCRQFQLTKINYFRVLYTYSYRFINFIKLPLTSVVRECFGQWHDQLPPGNITFSLREGALVLRTLTVNIGSDATDIWEYMKEISGSKLSA